MRAEACLDIIDLEELAHEIDEAPLEVAHMDVLLDDEAFDLVEHRRVGRVPVITVDTARHEDADRRFLGLHHAHLNRAGMGAKHFWRRAFLRVEEEGVMGFARRVTFREVQRGEIMPVILNVRAFGDGEAHIAEDSGDLFEDLHDRVQLALRRRNRRQGHIDALGLEFFLQLGFFQL